MTNKSQDLEIMVLRAEMKADEEVKQHLVSWYGQDVEVEEEENGISEK